MTKTQSILVKEDFRLRTKISYLESKAGEIRRAAATPMLDGAGNPYSLLLNMSDWQIGELNSAIRDLEQARAKYDIFKNYVHSHLSDDAKMQYIERVVNSRSVTINTSIGRPSASYFSCDNENLKAKDQAERFTMEIAGFDVPCERSMTKNNYTDIYSTALTGILSQAAQQDLGYLPENAEVDKTTESVKLPDDAETKINEQVEHACDYLEKTELSSQAPSYEEKQYAMTEITKCFYNQKSPSTFSEENPMEQ